MDIASLLQSNMRLRHYSKTSHFGFPALDKPQDLIVQMAHDRQGLIAGAEWNSGTERLLWQLAGTVNLEERILALIRITDEFEGVEKKLEGVSSTLQVPGIRQMYPDLAESVKLLKEYQSSEDALRLKRLQ